MKKKRTGLGRGISALISNIESMDEKSATYFMCRIDDIIPNRFQPRKIFLEEELEKLKESIQEQGILQPLLVRKIQNGYELIAGERRLRAAKKTDLQHVPAISRDLTDEEMLEVTIIENIQREDLNPLEEAEAYHRLINEFNYTQAQVAQKIGKNRSTVANFLRLKGLPDPIQESLTKKEISMGHARAILGAGLPDNQIRAWKTVMAKDLSVRSTEQLVQKMKIEPEKKNSAPPSPEQKQMKALSLALSKTIQSKVQIKRQGDKGCLEINFFSQDELQRIIALLERPL